MKKIVVILLLASLAGGVPAVAGDFKSDVSKKGTTAATFLSISQGARATAMGSAFVAVADDQSALYWNPAGIATLGNGVMFDHTSWFADIGYNYVAGTIGLGNIGTLGLSLTSSSISDMRVTTVEEPDGTGEVFNVSQVAASVAYAIQLTDNFSIGFNPKYVYERIWKMSASAFAIDAGVKYATPFEGIVLGMSISNFGDKMHMTGQSAIVLYDSDPDNTGTNGRIPAEISTNNWSLPLTFRVGLAYRPQLGDRHRLTVAVDALHPSDDYESLNVGAEYSFDGFVAIRGGYKSIFLKDTEESFTFGVGVRQQLLGNISLLADYCYIRFGRLSYAQKLTIGMGF
jgi:long-subunit fatty acid transport protein